MESDVAIERSDILAGAIMALVVGISLGVVLSSIFIPNRSLPDTASFVFESALAPLLVAILGAYASVGLRIRRDRIKQRQQERLQWKLQTVSLLQRIALELNRLDRDAEISRPEPTAVYQYDDKGPLSHVDSLFVELMEQYTEAPPEIDELWKVDIARLKLAYDDPGNHPEIDQDPAKTSMDFSYLINWFQPQLEHVLHKLGDNTEGVTAEQLPRYTAQNSASTED